MPLWLVDKDLKWSVNFCIVENMKAYQHTKHPPECSKCTLWHIISTKSFKPYINPPNILNDGSLTLWKGCLSIRKYLLLKASKFGINNLVWNNGYPQVVSSPKIGDTQLDIYLLRPESSVIACSILPRISKPNGVLLEVEWDEICQKPKVERIVPAHHKTDVLGLRAFFSEKV